MGRQRPDARQNSVVMETQEEMRVLFFVVSFVFTLLFIIVASKFFKPIHPFFDFFSDLSFAVIIIFTFILAVLGLSLFVSASRRTIRIIAEYSSRYDKLLKMTKELREEVYGDILLEKIMDNALAITHSTAGSLLLLEDNGALVFRIVRGEKAPPLLGTSLRMGEGLTGWSAQKGLTLRIDDVSKDERFDPHFDGLTGFQTRSIMCVPLKTKEHVIGVITLLNRQDGHRYRSRDEEVITYLAEQAAISILKTKFSEDQKNYEIHLTEILLEAMDHQMADKKGHSRRVARYSSIMAKALNVAEEMQKKLYFASLLHDVGFLKMSSVDVFNKEEARKHPVIGYEMIKPINFYADIAPIILHHHERYDGYGYPSGLKGDEIPMAARIIGIAEAFDAMTSETSYKIPVSFEDALEELQKNAGTQFDPDLVHIFASNVVPKNIE